MSLFKMARDTLGMLRGLFCCLKTDICIPQTDLTAEKTQALYI